MVEKVNTNDTFEIAGSYEYVVSQSNSKLFKVGDRVVFRDSRSYGYRGQTLQIVNEDDVEAIDAD